MSCRDVPKKCSPTPARYISPFWGFTAFTPTIPKLYWDVKSQEQRILRICDMLDKLICYSDYLGDNVDLNRKDIEDLKSEFEEFKEHGFDDYYLAQIEQWVNDHMADIISMYVKQVFFGLTLDGRFVAYIPVGSAWEDIVFDTGAVYDLDTYGRLMLYYETDSTTDVWQDNAHVNDLISLLSNLDRRITANEHALNDPVTEGDVDD